MSIFSAILPTFISQLQSDEPIYGIFPGEEEPLLSIHASLLDDFLAERRDPSHAPLGIEPLHNKGVRGKGVIIAVCDTGADPDHVDLRQQIIKETSRNLTNSTAGWADMQGHGTHVSGIAAAHANGQGIIGIAPEARLLICKVLDDTGSGASTWIAAGIRHAADNGAHIINLSLGGPYPDTRTQEAIAHAIAKGCWVICAAGNDGKQASSYPGHYPSSVAVAATDNYSARANFSTINAENDIAAPGVSIFSDAPGGRFATYSGTSMATPAVSGCLALVRSELMRVGAPVPNQAGLLEALKKTAKDIQPAGQDAFTGAGLIDTKALLEYLMPVVLPPQPPQPPVQIGKVVVDADTKTVTTPPDWLHKVQS